MVGPTVFGEFHPISANPLKLCPVGLERRCTDIFRSLQRCLIVRALAGPLKDIQRLVPKPLLRCLGCALRGVILLEGEASPQSAVLSALEQVFIKDLSVLCSVHLSFDPD